MTLKEELERITLEARTPEAETNRIVELMREAAEDGVECVTVLLPEDNEYKILANLTNEYCKLNVELVDEENRMYEISWVENKEAK